MACSEYECLVCGEPIFNNGKPDVCPECGNDDQDKIKFVAWDEQNLSRKD